MSSSPKTHAPSVSPNTNATSCAHHHHHHHQQQQQQRTSSNSSPCCGKRPRTPIIHSDSSSPLASQGHIDAIKIQPQESEPSVVVELNQQQLPVDPLDVEEDQVERTTEIKGSKEDWQKYETTSEEGEPHTKIARSSPVFNPENNSEKEIEEGGKVDVAESPIRQSQNTQEEDGQEETSTSADSNTSTRPTEIKDIQQQDEDDQKPPAQLPLAPRLRDYMAPGATRRFRPRPEWYMGPQSRNPLQRNNHASAPTVAASASPNNNAFDMFGPQPSSQLHRPAAAAVGGHMVAPDNGLLSDSAFADFFDEPSQQPPQINQEDDDDDENENAIVLPGNPLYVPQLHQHHIQQPHHQHVPYHPHQQHPPFFDDNAQHQNLMGGATAANSISSASSPSQDSSSAEEEERPPSTFGRDFDPALHVTIRENANEAALSLLRWGAPIEAENAKGVTPLILASQKGNIPLVDELLRRGANPLRTTVNGTTCVLQAAHFGHLEVLHLLLQVGGTALIEMANYNYTTPLMRASQEGHVPIVKALLDRGASVNRRNRVQMTALMLASQRGHSQVCQALVNKNAELDSMTSQHSTALLLACKRGHVDVARVLITAGCELWVQDTRGRTAREVAQRREMKELVSILDANVQMDWMQQQQRQKRNYDMILLWYLLQQERAFVPIHSEDDVHPRQVTIHHIWKELQPPQQLSMNKRNLPPPLPYQLSQPSTQALLRTMTLPAPLVELITKYIPPPQLWEKRVGMLTKRSVINADAAVTCALDLIDEILEEGGFADACDFAQVTPPTHFPSWREWKMYTRLRCRRGGPIQLPEDSRDRPNVTTAAVPKAQQQPQKPPAIVEMRRHVGFLQLLANRTPLLARVLSSPPYNMPMPLIQQLITTSDIQSLVRRMGSRGVHFEPAVAMDLIMLVSRLSSWFAREREDKPYPIYTGVMRPPYPPPQAFLTAPSARMASTAAIPSVRYPYLRNQHDDGRYRPSAPGP